MLETLSKPWPWYIAGPLIGLIVPALLLLGNKNFGISSSLRDLCAACLPAKIPFFEYDWKKEVWNLFFVAGILLGSMLSVSLIDDPKPVVVADNLKTELATYGLSNYESLLPIEIFNWANLFTIKGFLMMIVGGFFIGFGTRYGGGCTSGHAIMGISSLQWPSLVATISFMAGGFIMANLILPHILSL